MLAARQPLSRCRGRPLGVQEDFGWPPQPEGMRSEEQPWLGRSDPNRQPQREAMGVGALGGLSAPKGSLLAHRPRNSGGGNPAHPPDLPPALTLPNTNRPQALGGAHPVPHPSHSLWHPASRAAAGIDLHSSLGHRCLFTLMGKQGWGAMLRETSHSETPPRDLFPRRRF